MDKRKQVIIRALQDKDENVRSSAAAALEKLETRQRLGMLENLLDTGDKVEKLRAVYAVAALRGEGILNLLVKAAGDATVDVRAAAVRSLGRFGDKRVLPAIVERLKDESSVVVRVAVESLANLWDPRLMGPLLQTLKSKDHGVIEISLEVIGKSGDKKAEQAMIYFAVKGNVKMRSLALEALGIMES